MPSLIIRLLLFMSSYFPLTVIFFVLHYAKNRALAIGILAAGVLGIIGVGFFLFATAKLNPIKIELASIRRRDGDAMSYIVTYLLPFLTVPLGGCREVLSVGIFFVVLCILYVNSDMIHINPMLNLLGYHVYEVELKNGGVHSLLARRLIRRPQVLSVVKVADEIFREVRA